MADDLDDHVTKREVVEAFEQMGREWDAALQQLRGQLDQTNARLDRLFNQVRQGQR